jgi:hypothetical protein
MNLSQLLLQLAASGQIAICFRSYVSSIKRGFSARGT